MRTACLLISVIFWIHSYSQAWVQNIALRIGYSQSTQSPDWYRPDQVNAWRNNIHAIYFGSDLNITINKTLGFKPGIQICQKGMRVDYSQYGPIFGDETDYMYQLSYLEIPLSFILRKWGWDFSAGFQGSCLLNSSWKFRQKQIYYTNQFIVTYIHAFNGSNGYNRFDYGINIGVSRKLNTHLDAEFQFLRGLTVPDKFSFGDIFYQESFLFGIKYYFLKPARYPVGRQ
jgi:hypothetical protein